MLDEYATGLDGRTYICELEAQFGKWWRLLVADLFERGRLVLHY